MSLVSGLLNQTLQKISSVTVNAYGDETKTIVYENIPCRFQMSQSRDLGFSIMRRAQTSSGVERMSYTAQVWLFPEYDNIRETDVVTQDDEDYKILKVEKLYSLEGEVDHIVLILE